MPFKDILVYLPAYPDTISLGLVDHTVAMCTQLGGKASAVALHVNIPVESNRLAEILLHLEDLAHNEEQRSLETARTMLARFEAQASAVGLQGKGLVFRSEWFAAPDRVAEIARTHDLCIVPYGEGAVAQRSLAEAVIFGSGRPVVVLPAGGGRPSAPDLRKVVIAWDGSRPAARAVADALPILTSAAEVRVLTVLNEKASATADIAAGLIRHLSEHGISALAETRPAAGDRIGKTLEAYLADHEAGLLVMGAYGHSRMREFILGGATESMLAAPPIPVLFSH